MLRKFQSDVAIPFSQPRPSTLKAPWELAGKGHLHCTFVLKSESLTMYKDGILACMLLMAAVGSFFTMYLSRSHLFRRQGARVKRTGEMGSTAAATLLR